ncbi:multidrug ABC transporter ATP-binding protein, partial [Stenotrophomonas maltophilia]
YLHYLRPVGPVLLATLIAGQLQALVEVAMFDYLGRIVDGYTNNPTLKMFAQGGRELAYVPESSQVERGM